MIPTLHVVCWNRRVFSLAPMMKGQLQWGRCSLLQALVVVAVAWLLPLASSSAGARHWAYTDEALADEVVSLPGAEELNVTFRQFSGGRSRSPPCMPHTHSLADGCGACGAQATSMWAGASSCTTGWWRARAAPRTTRSVRKGTTTT